MSHTSQGVTIWLVIVCVVIVAMIGVGGATRLTQSGLSMVDWKPISGIVPPLNQEQWMEEFETYKQFPEYQKINRGMSLDEFKTIFYWEYGHRVLGRTIGIIFLVPFVAFWAMGKLGRDLVPWLIGALVLGGLQGLMGWYMVKSGLVDMPRVSHFRLAAHLSLAMLILCYLYWLLLSINGVRRYTTTDALRYGAWAVLGLLTLQIVYGAFVAGLDAGLGFNTWPMMDDSFMAPVAAAMQPFWMNFIENGAMIQFVHRWMGMALMMAVTGYLVLVFMQGETLLRRASLVLLAATFVQFCLGVLTLINYVPVGLGVAHQVFACVVLLAAVTNCYLVGGRAT